MTAPRAAQSGWAPLPGWGGAYEVELHSGRARSVDRWTVDRLGRCRFHRGRELKTNRGGAVTLSHRAARRPFTRAQLIATAEAGQQGTHRDY